MYSAQKRPVHAVASTYAAAIVATIEELSNRDAVRVRRTSEVPRIHR
jgi:hypothetical protein